MTRARYMLEPVHNLARLQIRADDGQHALRLLDAMYQAVTKDTDLVIGHRTLPLTHLTGAPRERHKLREWVWRQYLADGIRALTLAGRWDEAVTHTRAHQGIGLHLMDGRQVEIIAHCLRGTLGAAQALLEEGTPTEPWEQQVASCLRVMCAEPDGKAASQDVAAMVGQFFGDEPRPGFVVFRTRLGLTVATLADTSASSRVLAQLAVEVIESGDGYAARELLRHRSLDGVSDAQREALTDLVAVSGLESGALPAPLLASLTHSVKIAGEALTAAL
ncbi:hypothetical protein ACFQ0B_75915 [Nonomuraea thailandensis]